MPGATTASHDDDDDDLKRRKTFLDCVTILICYANHQKVIVEFGLRFNLFCLRLRDQPVAVFLACFGAIQDVSWADQTGMLTTQRHALERAPIITITF